MANFPAMEPGPPGPGDFEYPTSDAALCVLLIPDPPVAGATTRRAPGTTSPTGAAELNISTVPAGIRRAEPPVIASAAAGSGHQLLSNPDDYELSAAADLRIRLVPFGGAPRLPTAQPAPE